MRPLLRLWLLIGTCLCVLAGILVPASTARPAGLVTVVTPRDGSLVAGRSLRLLVRTAPGATSFRAWLDAHDVTRAFHRRAGLWRATVERGPKLRPGVHHLFVRTADGGFADSRFVLGRRAPALLTLVGPPVRRAAGSAHVQVHVPRGGVLRVRVNGRRLDGAFRLTRFQTWDADLGANDGLRFGPNTISIADFRDDGRYDSERLVVRVDRSRPLVGAGEDRSYTIDDPARLDGRSSRASRPGAELRYRWEVVSSPAGAPTVPQLGATATPTLQTFASGLYRVRLVVTEQGPHGPVSASDVVTIDTLPADPPLGATIDTIGPSGAVTIAGQDVPKTGSGINVVVLRRSDREPLFSARYPGAAKSAMDSAAGDVRTWAAKAPQSLIVVTGTSGLQGDALPSLDDAVHLIGGSLDDAARTALQQGKAFSVIGVPKSPPGSAFTNFGVQTSDSRPVGDLSGYLQLSTASFEYGFVFPEYRLFDTRVAQSGTSNTMQIGGRTYQKSLPEGTAGFHVVIVDRNSLQPFQDSDDCNILVDPDCPHDFNEALPINTGDPGKDRQWQLYVGDHLRKFGVERKNALVFIQTIGTPKPTTTSWNGIASVIDDLGGTLTLFNELNGSGAYALVGGPGLKAAEASTRFGLPAVKETGALGRQRDSGFAPVIADSFSLDTQLLSVLYQSAKAFPAFTAGQQAADKYFANQPQLHLDGDDVRANYWNHNYAADWNNKKSLLDQVPFPGAGKGFTKAEFNSTRAQLDKEIGALNDVKKYFDNLEKPLFDSQLSSYVSLKNIGQQIVDAVRPPPDTGASGAASGLLGEAVGAAAGIFEDTQPEVAYAMTGLSVLIRITGALTGPNGGSIVGEVQGKALDLADQLVNQFQLSRDALEGIGKIVVSDYGKLIAVSGFKLNSAVQAGIVMNKGARRWFVSELMPVAWATWEINGVQNARDWYCFRPSADDEPVDPSHYFIFKSEPDTGQYRPIFGVNADLTPNRPIIRTLGLHGTFPGWGNDRAKPPPASLTDAIFSPIDNNIQTNNLGLFPEAFYEHNFTRRIPPMSQSPGDDCYKR